MNILKLPEAYKMYDLVLTNNSVYLVSGTTKKNILDSKSNFVELGDGSTINKSYILEFKINMEETRTMARMNKDYIKLLTP